jgi:2-dehydro-3-deoxyphosphogluconate aldolase / (4S)-4-hydroxy-2-oxoglutarate aldolase
MESVNSWFDTAFGGAPVMAILRGFTPQRTVELAQTAWAVGIDCVEVPIQTEEAIEALRATVAAGVSIGKSVGAGTVVSPELVEVAAAAGAAFTVAPGFDPRVADASHDAGLAHLPGVATGTDVQLAQAHGLSWVKAFPASVLGVDWFTAMRGPFPRLKFVATGGIDAANAADFLDAGASVVAVGSALTDDSAVQALAALLARRSTATSR